MSRNPIYIKLINSARWRKLRADVLKACPICEVCNASGRSVLASEVHHVRPVESVSSASAMERLMFDRLNLQGLCHACHSEIHAAAFSHSKESVQANNERSTKRFVDRFLGD